MSAYIVLSLGMLQVNIYYFNDHIYISNEVIKYKDIYSIDFKEDKNKKKYSMSIKVKAGTFTHKIKASDKDAITNILCSILPDKVSFSK
ncbi:hypothetical protein [Clostridium paraputrificum]|uniref:hypothetical protein n=1 Tax=Clostridium paraputrificum TaxID=29363 RepID=UPI003D349205